MDYFYIGKIENKLKKLKAEAGNSRNKLNNVTSKSKIEKSEISLNESVSIMSTFQFH